MNSTIDSLLSAANQNKMVTLPASVLFDALIPGSKLAGQMLGDVIADNPTEYDWRRLRENIGKAIDNCKINGG